MSSLVFLILAIAAASYGDGNFPEERTLLKKDSILSEDDLEIRIVGGRKVSIVNYPYTANYGLVCGAAVLSPDWLITAAHCGHFESVYTGSTFISRTLKSAVERHVVHPSYKNKSNTYEFDFDFQLLKVKTPLVLSKTTKPIKIGSDNDVVLGSFATVTGWGSTYEDGPTSDNLLAVDVPIISPKECKSKAEGEYAKYVSERMLCAGYKEGGRDTCQGDSGGPLVYKNHLIGVVSFGVGCAEPDMPGVYSQVTKVKEWISGVTGL